MATAKKSTCASRQKTSNLREELHRFKRAASAFASTASTSSHDAMPLFSFFFYVLLVPQTVWPHWGVLTVTVKARCSIEVVSEASGIFPVNFRTKCLLWHVHVHFDSAGSHKMLAAGYAYRIFPVNFRATCLWWHVHVHLDCAGSHKVCFPVLGSVFLLNIILLNIITFLPLLLLPPPQRAHHHLLIIIIINSNIIINMIIHSPFTPPTLFGASCRDNFSFPLLLLVIAFQGISRELQKTEIQYLRNFTERELWVSVEVFTGWRVAGSAKLCQPANDPPNLRGFRSAGAIIVYSVYSFSDIFACLLCNLLQPKPVEIGSIWWVRKFGLFLHLLEWSTVPQWCVHAMRREVPKGANLKCGLVDFQSCLLYFMLEKCVPRYR